MEDSGSLPPRPRPSIPARLAGAGARAGQRAAELTGIDNALQLAAEEAIVRAAQSPAAERALVRVLQGPAVLEAAAGALNSEQVEEAIVAAIDSEMIDRVWAELLDSDEIQRLIERIADAPEIRAAITQQGLGLIDDIGRQLARVARRLDDGLERIVCRLTRRKPRTESPPQAGAITRALAFVVDVLILDAILIGISAGIALVAGAFGISGDPQRSVVVAGAGVWLITGAFYLVAFWGLSGQTPGMRFLDIRLDASGHAPDRPAPRRQAPDRTRALGPGPGNTAARNRLLAPPPRAPRPHGGHRGPLRAAAYSRFQPPPRKRLSRPPARRGLNVFGPRSGVASRAACSAVMFSVTRFSLVRWTSGASTKRSSRLAVSITMPSRMCSR